MNAEQVKQKWWQELKEEYSMEAIVLAQYHSKEYGGKRPDYDEAESDIDSDDYLVLTDKEADERCREEIEEMVWAFTPSFLSVHTGVDNKAIEVIQSSMYESANESLTAMIKDFDHFVEDAISCDGRGHFLAGYDHEENHIEFDEVDYYIYRRN